MRWSQWLDELRQNVAYALRTLGRNPGYAAVAVLTMIIGIGANAAIFTVTDAVLLRPLPFADPSRLVTVFENKVPEHVDRSQMSPADVADYRAQQHSLTGLASFGFTGYAFQPRGGAPISVTALRVSPNHFDDPMTRPCTSLLKWSDVT